VWEAVYILDRLLKNTSDIQPDTLHADTQGQSTPVFGLAHLLGIHLMPRIRNWKDLTLFRPSRTAHYRHIDGLFAEAINWELMHMHLPAMLRVVLSIKAGRLTASTLLRRLGTYSRKNRLYLAFRELGRVVRTAFLLRYLSDAELRQTIHAATNKSEAFNRFVQWLFFGGEQLSWLSRVMGIIFLPRGPMFQHGVKNRQQLAHTRRECDLRRFPDRSQSLVERLEDGIVAHRRQGAHVQHGANVDPAPPDCACSPQGAAIVVERGDADQRGDLLAVQDPQLRNLCDQRPRKDGADARRALQNLVCSAPQRTGVDGSVAIFI
jgi:Tn3 transposase DDE domain